MVVAVAVRVDLMLAEHGMAVLLVLAVEVLAHKLL
jgi:hypothetical protein